MILYHVGERVSRTGGEKTKVKVRKKARYLRFDDVWEMLHGIGGCGAEPESWADGWDKAIDEAIRQLDEIPAVTLERCHFCKKIKKQKGPKK